MGAPRVPPLNPSRDDSAPPHLDLGGDDLAGAAPLRVEVDHDQLSAGVLQRRLIVLLQIHKQVFYLAAS